MEDSDKCAKIDVCSLSMREEPPKRVEERDHHKKERDEQPQKKWRGEVNHQREPQRMEEEHRRFNFSVLVAPSLLLSCSVVVVMVRPFVDVTGDTETIKKEREE